MPRFTPSILISDCWGSMGDLTFFHWGGNCYYKNKSRGSFAGTAAQQNSLDVHRRALAAWRTVPHETQKVWNTLAEPVISHKPPFDGTAHISGQNLFVSAYHGFSTLGNEHHPTPRAFEPFPPHSVAFFDASLIDATSLQLRFKTFFPDGIQASRYQILMKVQLAKPGYGKKPGLMRNFLATAPCSNGEGTASFLIDDFIARWGLDLDEYQVHCRYVLLDRETGYRNIHSPLSFLIKLR